LRNSRFASSGVIAADSCIKALRATAAAFAILIEAPGTVLLGLGRFFDADDNRENSRNEKQKSHERLDWPDTIRVPTAKTSWPLLEYQILSI
jgi:hypothetical protein